MNAATDIQGTPEAPLRPLFKLAANTKPFLLAPDGLAHPDCAKEALAQANAASHARDLAYLEGRA